MSKKLMELDTTDPDAPKPEDRELTHLERIDLAVCIYGLYTAGNPAPWDPAGSISREKAEELHQTDVICAMDNMRVPRYLSECSPEEVAKLESLANQREQPIAAEPATASEVTPADQPTREIVLAGRTGGKTASMLAMLRIMGASEETLSEMEALYRSGASLGKPHAQAARFLQLWEKAQDEMLAAGAIRKSENSGASDAHVSAQSAGMVRLSGDPEDLLSFQDRLYYGVKHFNLRNKLQSPPKPIKKMTAGEIAAWDIYRTGVMDAAGVPKKVGECHDAIVAQANKSGVAPTPEDVGGNIFSLVRRITRMKKGKRK